LSESEAISIVKDIVNGFLEIGEKKFLHRDLKLANILMNDKGVAKIADFGFAKKSLYSSIHAVTNLKRKSIMLVVLSTCLQKLSKRTSTLSKMIFGLLESWSMSCCMGRHHGIVKLKINLLIR